MSALKISPMKIKNQIKESENRVLKFCDFYRGVVKKLFEIDQQI